MSGSAYDIAIVGAGAAGCATAIEIAGAASVALIDRDGLPAPKIGESLPGAARPILHQLGVLSRIECGGHLASAGVLSCWGREELVARDAFAEPGFGGWLLDRPAFEAALRCAAVEAGATLIAGAAIVSATRTSDRNAVWELTPKQGPAIRARFLVDATGRTARLLRSAGNATAEPSDRLICRFARLPPAPRGGRFDAFLLVEAVSEGWWYSVALPNGQRIVAFHSDADLPAAVKARTAGGFAQLFGETRHLRALIQSSERLLGARIEGAAAQSRRRAAIAGQDWACVGDAAISFDPLSSQGLTNALYSGLQLGRALCNADRSRALSQYEDQLTRVGSRYFDNQRQHYELERRFLDRPFWMRRHSTIDA